MWYLAIKLTVPGVESPIILALIKMPVNSLYFTMAELTRTGSLVPGYIYIGHWASTLWQFCDTVLIKNNGVTRKMGCNPNLERLHCFQWEQSLQHCRSIGDDAQCKRVLTNSWMCFSCTTNIICWGHKIFNTWDRTTTERERVAKKLFVPKKGRRLTTQ